MDINGDGYNDLIYGEGNTNNLNFYSGTADGSLHYEGDLITIPTAVNKEASPVFADFDSDGDLDMILGSAATWAGGARLYYCENSGTLTDYQFNSPLEIQREGGVNGAKVTTADLDGDGLLDCIYTVGFPGKCMYIRNTGTATSPDFTGSPEVLSYNNSQDITAQLEPIGSGTTLKPTFRVSACDWNEDGSPDLLFGRGVVSLFLGEPKATGIVSPQLKEQRSDISFVIGAGVLELSTHTEFSEPVSLSLYSLSGRRVAQAIWESGSRYTIQTASIAKGIYFLSLSSCTNKVNQKSMIVIE